MTSGDCRRLKILPCTMCFAFSRSRRFWILAFSHHGNNNPMLPFKTELHFFPVFFFYHTVSSTLSFILTHTQVSSFFLLFWVVGRVAGYRWREERKETGRVCEREWYEMRERKGAENHRQERGEGGKMRESFLSCLSALASRPVIQSISQTEAVFFPPPLDVLYLAGVLLQLGI